MDIIAGWFIALNRDYGINLSPFYDSFDRRLFLDGLLMTIWLSVVSIAGSLIVGLVGAWTQTTRIAPLRWLVQAYIQFFRNTPPLIQLYFFYFALGAALPTVAGPDGAAEPPIGNVAWAIISLSFCAGAYNAEIFRSGIEAVPSTTVEAAEALGFSRFQTFIYVIMPLAVRVSLPALGNNLINLIKTTTLAYAIAVPELLYASAQIWSEQLNVRSMMNLLLVLYVALIGIFVFLQHRLERRLRLPGFGR